MLAVFIQNIAPNKNIKVCIKNPPCYYFSYIIKNEDFEFDNNLFNEKSYKNNLIDGIFYKTLIDVKHLRIIFDNVDGFIKDYDGTKWVVLIGFEK